MKKNTVKIIKDVKILAVLILAELMKLYYVNRVEQLSKKITDRINKKYVNKISMEELDKLFPDKEVSKI